MNAVLSRCLIAASLLALVAGCDKEDVHAYSVPRDDDPGSGPARVLAAIIPVREDTWFVKLSGRGDVVALVEPAFDQVIGSLAFPEVKTEKDLSLAWKVPAGWKEDRSKPNRVATLTPEGTDKIEMTITRLGPMAAAVKPNVDRWRRLDLGQLPITPRALPKVVSEKAVAGHTVTLVKLSGPGRAKAALPANHPPGERRPPRGKRPRGSPGIKYRTPEGWREVGSASFLVAAELAVRDGSDEARVKVTPLPGSMPGGLADNVTRWRQDVDLPPLSAEALKDLRTASIRVAGSDAKMIDLQGKAKRSLVVWFEREGTTWFFKMIGPSRLVGAQRGNFESFLQSVQFTGGAE